MIVTSTIVLVLALCGILTTEAAPIGTRNFDVRSMRRLETSQMLAARNVHHSAHSYVTGGANDKTARDTAVPNVAREVDEAGSNRGWRRERVGPRHDRNAKAQRHSLRNPNEPRQVKGGTIPVENARKSEIPDINLVRKSEPAVEARTTTESGQRGAENIPDDRSNSRTHPGSPPSPQSETQDQDQRRNEPSSSEIAARSTQPHISDPNPGKSAEAQPEDSNVGERRSSASTSLPVVRAITGAWRSLPQ